MKKKYIALGIIVVLSLLIVVFCAARFVFLSPSCYTDNKNLTDRENYFIKKRTLEAVEDRLSVFADTNSSIYDPSASEIDIIQLDKTQNERKHVFVLINYNFMDSVQKTEDGYILHVQTYGMEESSSDCIYELCFSKDFTITFFGLDP